VCDQAFPLGADVNFKLPETRNAFLNRADLTQAVRISLRLGQEEIDIDEDRSSHLEIANTPATRVEMRAFTTAIFALNRGKPQKIRPKISLCITTRADAAARK